ncbi:MAG: hypothetical protein JXR51_11765 [Bacteroidales bacterium]|nr:hypothetical protein [Bacteroidales bacterium]MBN2757847.1 hypothetical protein [Bacteroidales bacterium]
MKKEITLLKLLFVFLILPVFVQAQDDAENETKESVYRRSSLYTLMIHEPSRPFANVIDTTFSNAELPDKFNNHLLSHRKIINAVSEDIKNNKEKENIQIANIESFLDQNQIAKKMIAKWFNRTENGAFDMNLVAERGSYNASEMDVELAKSSKRGLSLLADAGEELIRNTFVVVNDFKYISKEEIANKTKKGLALLNTVAQLAGKDISTYTDLASAAVTVAGKGYVIKTTSYLYRLAWNDSIAAVFYNEYWMDENSIEQSKKTAFDNSDIFKLELVGYENAWADLQSSIFTTKSEEQLISMATVRAVDKVIAKLQRTYEVFRTKTPLYSANPLAAKIGLKEDIEKGDKFEVLQQYVDKEGITKYKRKGVIRVNPKQIWDNRFMAAEEQQAQSGEDANKTDDAGEDKNFTLFIGGKNYYKGMLIRQIN